MSGEGMSGKAMSIVNRLATGDADFDARLRSLLAFEAMQDESIESAVTQILAAVRKDGDQALLDYTARFDNLAVDTVAELTLPSEQMRAAFAKLPQQQRDALEKAASRIRIYHEKQRAESWSFVEADGTRLGQKVTALDRVGVYVPGGKAAYPSTVLMNTIPAKVAGVGEVIMVVPTPGGRRNDLVLAAAHIAGVDRVFTVGGAQAVAALAYGTQWLRWLTVPKVFRKSTRLLGPATRTSRRPSAACSVWSASIWWRDRPRSW
jgi:histidinol dehydrogenase